MSNTVKAGEVFDADMVIPRYAFEADATVGNPYFHINRGECVMNYEQKEDLLVPHRKDHYFMVFVKAGNSRHWIDMTPYTVQSNAFYFCIPHQVLLKEDIQPFTGFVISFTKEFLALDEHGFLQNLPVIQNPLNGHELLLNETDQVYIENLLNQLMAEYLLKHEWQMQMLLSYMKTLLIYLSRLYTEQFKHREPGSNALLKSFLAKVDALFIQQHDVAAYADMLHISAGHLSEVVKEQSGKPAIAHIHERLMLEAKRLLFRSEGSVKEIAYELGFEDASYFNRFFKRLAGQTPVEYRKFVREMYH
ncbi:AraC-type DNA-binding protein [Filimonas lacunae]|uniref:AraC-type DNA-binding protein n=1 Tax=Filimonas lacunae TaxID=477680 RepID=A0A1N7N7K2_9BACT|nr:helix-turn-helix transcriptional regulator [Filimonas lacunae]SIS94334.1 AraC-type DNA-binding protein [Filimonas lacunae]